MKMFTKEFWTAKGVISRWQLFLAYVLIAGAFGLTAGNLHRDSQATKETIVRECKETNARNVSTKASLVAAAAKDIAKAEANAKARKQNPELFKNEIEGRRDVTLALIDTLAPKRDCNNLVR